MAHAWSRYGFLCEHKQRFQDAGIQEILTHDFANMFRLLIRGDPTVLF